MNLEKDVQTWLAKYFNTEEERIKQILKTQLATTYLLIWPIMEQALFKGFMKKNDIERVATKLESYYSKLDAEESARYFHDRYKDKNLYRNLKHGNDCPKINRIISKSFEDTSSYERLMLLLYVVYRYRNNIFHGNKGISSWTRYGKEINLCIRFMMNIVDCSKEHNLQ